MKNIIVGLALCALASSASAIKEKTKGSSSYTDKTFDELEIMGTLTGSGLKASSIEVYGPANLSKNTTIGTATIYGPLNSSDTLFSGAVETHGPVKATHTIFKDSLTTQGNDLEIVLENSTAKSIGILGAPSGFTKSSRGGAALHSVSIQKESSSKGNRVILKGKSTSVGGPIEFINEPGRVILLDQAAYNGQIVNGKLDTESSEILTLESSKVEGGV